MYLPALYFVTPVLTSIMCVWENYSLTRWLRINEATNVKYKIYVYCFKHRIHFIEDVSCHMCVDIMCAFVCFTISFVLWA